MTSSETTQPTPPRSATPAPSIESAEPVVMTAEAFFDRLLIPNPEQDDYRALADYHQQVAAKARADERARVIEALHRLKAMKPPDQRDVDYALARIEERGLGPLIDELNALATPEGGRAVDQPVCCWPHCERGSGSERCPDPLTADCAPDQEHGS